jgi:excisionase family DNA binding protein
VPHESRYRTSYTRVAENRREHPFGSRRADGMVAVQMRGTPHDSALAEVRFLTVAEVATLMRVSKMTVYRLVHSGELAAVRVGRSFRVPEHAVHEYLRDALSKAA